MTKKELPVRKPLQDEIIVDAVTNILGGAFESHIDDVLPLLMQGRYTHDEIGEILREVFDTAFEASFNTVVKSTVGPQGLIKARSLIEAPRTDAAVAGE